MKKKFLSSIALLTIGIAVVFSSCTTSVIEDGQFELDKVKTADSHEDHNVKYTDILTLCQVKNANTRSSSQTSSTIECLTSNSNDTVLYVSKEQGGGWTMYSSDTRVPAIVAHSKNGSFEKLMQIDGAKLWIQSIVEDMALIKKLPDEMLNFSQKEIAENKAFWKSISSPDEYVKDNLLSTTRAVEKDPILITGHYELRFTDSYAEVYDSIPRMTATNWHQSYPYNYYCPLKSDNSINADAGCVAIAAAQMLYYLHYHYGVPATAPSEAYCNGNITSYTWAQTNYTTSIWDNMIYGINAAPLIADVGRRVNMDYGDEDSGASTSDLPNKVFAPYGISCSYTDYNTDLLKNSLINEMPVILRASTYVTTNNGTEIKGHVFIADRYKRTRIVTENYYEWVYDTYPPHTPLPWVPEKIEYTYSSPTISMIGMNWGWKYHFYNDDEWFSLTGDWYVSPYNFNISRHMIHGFQVINN